LEKRRSISRRRRLVLAGGVGLSVLAADQASKAWASRSLPYDRLVRIVPGWFGFGLIRNSGAAFGALSGRDQLLTVVTACLIVVFAWLLLRGSVSGWMAAASLGAVLGGGLGNLVDRVRLGSVVDFIELRPWPADFNLADVAIRVGAVLLLVSVFLQGARRPRPN
jgi:signal peptidase II